jgi:hypothetical protein
VAVTAASAPTSAALRIFGRIFMLCSLLWIGYLRGKADAWGSSSLMQQDRPK